MSFDTSWDIEKYKSKHESADHWNLKRDFLLAHKDKYPEARLIALANCFLNIKFLGCKYPEKVMDLVKELSEGIGDSSGQEVDSLKRTFVAGSDAAGSKYKRNSRCSSHHVYDLSMNVSEDTPAVVHEENSSSDLAIHTSSKESENLKLGYEYLDMFKGSIVFVGAGQDLLSDASSIAANIFKEKHTNAQFAYIVEGVDLTQSEWKCEISINDAKISSATASTKPAAKKLACYEFLKLLQTICFTIKEKVKFYGQTIERSSVTYRPEKPKEPTQTTIGSRMMMNMGWNKGKGLGAREQGILEPVTVNEGGVARSGLGSDVTTNEFKTWLILLLQDYKGKGEEADLIFSKDFTRDERKIIHSSAQKMNLRTRSYGTSADRQLVVTNHIKDLKNILKELLIYGGENTRYLLEYPTADQ